MKKLLAIAILSTAALTLNGCIYDPYYDDNRPHREGRLHDRDGNWDHDRDGNDHDRNYDRRWH